MLIKIYYVSAIEIENSIEFFIENGRQKYNQLMQYKTLFIDETNFVNVPDDNDLTEGDIGRIKSILRRNKQKKFETVAEENMFNTNKRLDFFVNFEGNDKTNFDIAMDYVNSDSVYEEYNQILRNRKEFSKNYKRQQKE